MNFTILIGIPFSDIMQANLENEQSTTDVISQALIQTIQLSIMVTCPFFVVRFSKVFTKCFQETARLGRKVTSNVK